MNPLVLIGGGLLGLVGYVAFELINDSLMEETVAESRERLARIRAQQYAELQDFYRTHKRQMSRRVRREFRDAMGNGPEDMDLSYFDDLQDDEFEDFDWRVWR